MKNTRLHCELLLGILATLSVLCGSAAAAVGDEIYVLGEPQPNAAGVPTPPYSFRSTGSVPGAKKLAVPETGAHILVLTDAGEVWAWGDNSNGQLGAGNTLPHEGWEAVKGLSGISAVAAGALHSVALRGDGTVWTWGANDQGQLGDGSLVSRALPAAVPDLSNVTGIAAGRAFTLALRGDGTVWAFGNNWSGIAPGEPGRSPGRTIMRPVQVSGLSGIAAVAIFNNAGYAKDGAGRIWVWGNAGQDAKGAPREMSAVEIAPLQKELEARFAPAARTTLDSAWAGNWQRQRRAEVQGNSVRVVDGAKQTEFQFAGSVTDVEQGWAVALIAAPDNLGGSVPDSLRSSAIAPAIAPAVAASAGTRVVTQQGGRAGSFAITARVGTLTADQNHSLVVQPNGTICGAGQNEYGELGDGTAVTRLTPVPAAQLTGIVATSAGWYHSIALRTDGTVWTWGYNAYGELGDNTNVYKPTPIQVPNLTGVIAVAAGGYHSVALKSDGTVWSFGYNGNGQLGDGTNTNRSVPVQAIGVSGIVAIAAGQRHTLALRNDGTVLAWGNNASGQLGDGTYTSRTSAVQVAGLAGATAVAAGSDHSIALLSDTSVWDWGYNGYGQLGDGSTTYRPNLVRAGTLTGAVAIAGGTDHTLAVLGDGSVWGWGLNNSGQLGDGTLTNHDTPVQTNGVSTAVAVAGGDAFSLTLNSDGTQSAWGDNTDGELANGTTTSSLLPVTSSICGIGTFPGPGKTPLQTRFSASQSHSLVVKNDGSLWGWGQNEYGELGNGTTLDSSTPVQAAGLVDITAVSAGWYHTAALKSDGTVWTWGYNAYGELGNGSSTTTSTPLKVPSLAGEIAVAAGGYHTVVLRNDGTVWTFGYNGNGQLGTGTTTSQTVPVQAIGVSGIIAIAAGQRHTLALSSNGTVLAWGNNASGQLGNGTYTNATSAVQVAGLSGVIAIAAGSDHSLALKSDGTVWTWGYDGYGQLGDGGGASYRPEIVRASGLTGIVAIAGGDDHSLAVDQNGVVWAWGADGDGQLGNGTEIASYIPAPVFNSTGFSALQAVAAGTNHSLALMSDGTVWAWGSNSNGQFGSPTPANSTVPVATTQTGVTFFSDVFPTDFDYAAIQIMAEHTVTNGCLAVPEDYCPNNDITRGQMAVFIVRTIMGGDNFTYSPTPYFTDVPTTYPFFKWIQKMKELQVTAGCTATTYCPDSNATRGQMAVFIIRARFGSTAIFTYPSTPYFTDVPASYSFFSWIQKMAEIGITSGCGPMLYCPDDPVTRGQMAVFIVRGGFNGLLPAGTPVVSALAPSVAPIGQTVTITLQGLNTNFVQGTTALTPGVDITVGAITVISPTRLSAILTVSSTAVAGPRSVTVTTGAEEATLPNFLVVQ